MTEPRVSTETSTARGKLRAIQSCLRAHPEGVNPKTIAAETGINVNTVKTCLPKIPNLQKPMRGIYKVSQPGDGPVRQLDELTDWNFHNCILSAPCVRDSDDVVFVWGPVKLDLRYSRDRVVLRLSSPSPLNVASLCFVAGFVERECGVPWRDVSVSSIEFNKDFSNLRLDGVRSITVGSLFDQFKAYQKSVGLRAEHKSKIPFSMENIVDMLSQNPLTVDAHVKLNALSEQLSRLTKGLYENRQLLYALADGDAA